MGADPHDVAEVEDVLRQRGLTVLTDAAWTGRTRLVRAEGTVGALMELFGAELERVSSPHPQAGAQAGAQAGLKIGTQVGAQAVHR